MSCQTALIYVLYTCICSDAVGCTATVEPLEEWPSVMERSCDTLVMCLLTAIKEGVKAGGGISDILRKPSSDVSPHTYS